MTIDWGPEPSDDHDAEFIDHLRTLSEDVKADAEFARRLRFWMSDLFHNSEVEAAITIANTRDKDEDGKQLDEQPVADRAFAFLLARGITLAQQRAILEASIQKMVAEGEALLASPECQDLIFSNIMKRAAR
jgi:hypothetical protein